MRLLGWLAGFYGQGNRIVSRGARARTAGGRVRRREKPRAVELESLESRVVLATDFGDAPDTGAGTGPGNYETLLANDGPRHTVVAGLRLGAFVGGEADANQNATATGDDIGADDEDGVASPLGELRFAIGTQSVVTLSATNATGSAATLYGWIDFNNNGQFENATERASVVVPNGTTNGLFTLSFPTITSTFTGTTFARFRLSTDAAAANSTGAAADGEVEDYRAEVIAPTGGTVKSGGITKIASGVNGGPTLADRDVFGASVATIGDIDADGVIDLVVGAIQDGVVPPTINYMESDPECDLNYVPNRAEPRLVNAGMCNAFGFGGQNASMVIRRFDP